jgi:hypothetical protein
MLVYSIHGDLTAIMHSRLLLFFYIFKVIIFLNKTIQKIRYFRPCVTEATEPN